MYTLGLNAYHGDSSACIFKNGDLIAAIEEERLRRIKHWAGFPSESIKFCLNECGINIEQVDHITISRDPKANFLTKIGYGLKKGVSLTAVKDRLLNLKKVNSVKDELADLFGIEVKKIKAKVHNIEHHRAHMASAFFASDFDESAILSIDGFGDFSSTMIGIGRGTKIEVLDRVMYPHSVGVFYTAFTQLLGFANYGDEYKVMGLSPYGKPTLVDKVRDVLIFKDNGLFEINEKYFKHPKEGVDMNWDGGVPYIGNVFSSYMEEIFGKARVKGEELTQFHKDLAASVQRVTEELIFHILNSLQERTGLKNICIAGGVAQNSVANGKILERTNFNNLYIPPAGHDAGTSIGSALWLYNHELGYDRIEPMSNSFFGSKFSDEDIEEYLISIGVKYKKFTDDELNDKVVSCLLNAGVVGWFQGRAEFGPRALGHRSIIADPTRDDAKEILNLKIKRREPFRPFAPSILEEYVDEHFEKVDHVPFMEKVFQIREEKRSILKAVTHVDGSGRLQTVSKSTNKKYYSLIKSFYERTGVPILLNTSFNENEPIVNTPEEAYACFARTKMDMVVMGNIVVER
ncbi:carbamoyltransferase [Halobacteriovorax marinus]|uniref:carbamoyltransferase family protein n=1 Tax=Halobacteriovorax marinus TaxID=97084 RepID=UPI003A8FFC2E